MVKISTVIFWILAVSTLIFGLLYTFVWPLAPYHEYIIGMTAQELASSYPDIHELMTGLVGLVGMSFLAIGIFTAYLGYRAWKDKYAWLSLLLAFIVLTAPLTYGVYLIGGPIEVMIIQTILTLAGLAVSATVDKNWEKG